MQAITNFSTNEWAILFLVLVLGWLLGLISRAGGAKWRRAYEAERDARIEDKRDHDAAIAAADARIAALEAARPPVVAPVAAPARVSSAETLDLRRDDLSIIRGIGKGGERRLNAQGIYRYSELANLPPAEDDVLERKLGADPGYIAQEEWREQAALLDAGRIEEHRARFG